MSQEEGRAIPLQQLSPRERRFAPRDMNSLPSQIMSTGALNGVHRASPTEALGRGGGDLGCWLLSHRVRGQQSQEGASEAQRVPSLVS